MYQYHRAGIALSVLGFCGLSTTIYAQGSVSVSATANNTVHSDGGANPPYSISSTYSDPISNETLNAGVTGSFGRIFGTTSGVGHGPTSYETASGVGQFSDYLVVTGANPSDVATVRFRIVGTAAPTAAGAADAYATAAFNVVDNAPGRPTSGSESLVRTTTTFSDTGAFTLQAQAGDILQLSASGSGFASISGANEEDSSSVSYDYHFYVDSLTPGMGLAPGNVGPSFIGSGFDYSSVSETPEPGSLALLAGAGMAGILLRVRRHRRQLHCVG